VNTIFASHLIDSKGRFVSDEPVRQTTEIQAVSHGMFLGNHFFTLQDFPFLQLVIVENGVKLRLNIVDTPGYGDQINNENWYVWPMVLFLLASQP
jgi:septin family protein